MFRTWGRSWESFNSPPACHESDQREREAVDQGQLFDRLDRNHARDRRTGENPHDQVPREAWEPRRGGQAARDVGDQENEANEHSHLGSRERGSSGRQRDVGDPEQEDQGQDEADYSQTVVSTV